MKIAVSSNRFRKVGGHAGRARQWLVFEVDGAGSVKEATRVTLEAAQVFHHYRQGPHPLEDVKVLITHFAGPGFLRRMEKQGVEVALTSEIRPGGAVASYLAGTLPPPHPRGILGLICKVRDALSGSH